MVRNNVSPARWAAFEILRRVHDGAHSANLLAAAEPRLQVSDRALCHELVLGVLRWQLLLDKFIEHYADRKVESLDLGVLISLRLGLYQLRFLTRVPPSAAVDESVRMVQAARLSSARALVNAVLRRATRETEYDPVAQVSDPVKKLAIKSSHPEWLVKGWIQSFGQAETEAFTAANNETPHISFRVVHTITNDEEVFARLNGAGIKAQASKLVEGSWRIATSSPVLRELADEGKIYFQDEASQMVATLVAAQAGDRVLDVCSAPGGKTAVIAMNARHVVAADISLKRLAQVIRTVSKQQISNISFFQLDGSQSLPFKIESFDRVLVDAPCSGTGTLRHNPEIRWRISSNDICRLAAQQEQLLSNASSVLRPGGRLVYSTCSVELAEDEEVVKRFLLRHNNFQQIPLLVKSVSATESGALRTWPHVQGVDGFFVAAFQKF